MTLPSATAHPTDTTLVDMLDFAQGVMASRAPDFDIGPGYLQRWYLVPRNAWSNVYLHRFLRSDDDRALHDHPWASTSFIIEGRYREHTQEGVFERQAGDVVSRPAEALHRVELYPGEIAVTLFLTGPKIRDWGFQCPQGWVPWQIFTDPTDSSRTGRGCEQ